MSISHLSTICQDSIWIDTEDPPPEGGMEWGEIPVEWPTWDGRTDTPTATPLADLLAASYRDGSTDAAGADAAMMTYEEYLEAWDFEPEPSYWE